MLERLILRYSGEESIQRHNDVMASTGGYTWWGWWAKSDQERIPFDWLEWAAESATSGSGLRVGLVDRKLGRYGVAICTEVMFDPNGVRQPPPEGGTKTPDYYRANPLPAWFKFVRVDTISLVDFEREFVEVPVGDATLYVVDTGTDERRTVLPQPNWDFEPYGVAGNSVLVMSDLHFGSSHGYLTERGAPGTSVGGATLCDRLTQVIELSKAQVGVVFVTGDLVTKGQDIRATLEEFESLTTRLRKRFGLAAQQFVIIPGNHDFTTVTNYVEMKIDYKHELDFKRFLKDFYGRPKITDIEQPFRFVLPNGVEVAGLALNSARLRDEKSRDYGFIARHRYERLLGIMRSVLDPYGTGTSRPTIFSALLHHHLVPVNPLDSPIEGRHVSVTVDAGEVVDDFLRMGIQVAFHGHQHLPFLGSVRASRPQNAAWDPSPFGHSELCIVGAGSAGVARASLPDVFPFNSVALFDVREDARSLEAQVWRYLPGLDPALAARCELPISPWSRVG